MPISPTLPAFLRAIKSLVTGPEDVGDVGLPTPAPIRGAGAQAIWDATDPDPMAGGLDAANFPGGSPRGLPSVPSGPNGKYFWEAGEAPNLKPNSAGLFGDPSGPGAVPGYSASDLPRPPVNVEEIALRQLRALAKPPAAFAGASSAGGPTPPTDWETLIPRPNGASPTPGTAAAAPGSGTAAAGGRGTGFSWSGAAPSASELAAERTSFLSGGQSPEIGPMADAIRGRELAAENVARNRPDLYQSGLRENEMEMSEAGTPTGRAAERQTLRDEGDLDLATRALRRAILGRDADVERNLTPSMTFMRPEAGAARYAQFEEGLNEAQNPRMQLIQEQQFQRDLQKAILAAYGRLYGSPMGGALAPGLGQLGGFFGLEAGGGGAAAAPGAGGPPPPDGGPAVRRTKSGQTVRWDGRGWAIQE